MQSVMYFSRHLDYRVIFAGCVLLAIIMLLSNTMACSTALNRNAAIVKPISVTIQKKVKTRPPVRNMRIRNDIHNLT